MDKKHAARIKIAMNMLLDGRRHFTSKENSATQVYFGLTDRIYQQIGMHKKRPAMDSSRVSFAVFLQIRPG